MSRVVYTAETRAPLAELVSPLAILRHLYRHRELIAAYAEREFQATHRGTFLGLAWSVISPLIMLALFVGVFGYVFGGRFSPRPDETPAEFALALFVGLSFYNCVGQTLSSAPGLVLANNSYVKTLAFPLEVLSVAAVVNVLRNLAISLAICFTALLAIYHKLPLTALALVFHILCIALISLGISWFLSSLALFVRDVPSIIAPVSTVLMFVSGVFFPLSAVSVKVRWLLKLNPLAVILEQARGALLYGQWPDPAALALVFAFSLAIAIGGYWFFMRAKPAFADVI